MIIGALLLSPLLLLGIIRLAKEKLRTIVIIGLSLGTLLGAILLTWLTILGEYVPVQGIILTNVLPIYLLTIIIIILTAKYSYRHKL